MRKKVLSLALALVMCLGLTVPAFAAESKWKVEVSGKPNAHVGERTFTVRDWVISDPYEDEDGYSMVSLTKTDSHAWTVSNLYVVSKGDTMVFTKGGEEFPFFTLDVWSDPDGDGVYDGRAWSYEEDYVLWPADTAGPLHASAVAPPTQFYLNHWPDGSGISYDMPYIDSNYKVVLTTEAKLSADTLLEKFGPNTLVVVSDNDWSCAILVEGNSQPTIPTVGGFTDVKTGDYFADPVLWAVEKKITAGTSKTTFSPNENCSVAQILTFLWRANGSPKPTTANPFSDVKSGDYYAEAAVWAYEKGMVSGSTFGGNTPCTRSMAVTYMWKAAGSPAASYDGKFGDVPANADYAQAVAWALANGITSGTSATTFGPASTCSRCQIMTFLYRAFAK